MENIFRINKRKIGDNYPPLIIAEIGINHNGSLDRAIQIADSAIKAGAEVIKHQTHITDAEMSLESKSIVPGNAKESIYKIIKKCELSELDEIKLANYIKKRKRIFISTPFSREAAVRLVKIGVPVFKIGSGESNNHHFVDFLTKFKLPIIMSLGMNSLDNLKKSIDLVLKKKIPLALLHCTNIYPTPSNLNRIDTIKKIKNRYPDCVVGFSDHSENIFAALGAVANGARIIEKHYIDSKKYKGPDISSSMDRNDLKLLIKGSNEIFLSRGLKLDAFKEEQKTIAFAFPSVVALCNLSPGTILSKNNIFLKRPFKGGDYGVSDLNKLYGKKIKRFVLKNTQVKKKHLT
jgi:N-acetylneuraminate synthase